MEIAVFLYGSLYVILSHYLSFGISSHVIKNQRKPAEAEKQISKLCSISPPMSDSERVATEKRCQELADTNWKEEYRKCCEEMKKTGSVCGSRSDGTYGTVYYNLCSLYRERYLNPGTCILNWEKEHHICERCGIMQTEPPPCDGDLQAEDMKCKTMGSGKIPEDECYSTRCMTAKEKEDDTKECAALESIDWKGALMKCCQEPKQMHQICGSRYNGTLGTLYYNECALIFDRYQHPDDCILERMWDHVDCKKCGIEQTEAFDCSDIPTTVAPTTTVRQPETREEVAQKEILPNLERQVDQECSRLQTINWEEELLKCCGLEKGPQMVCGKRRNNANTTLYYNECSLIRDRYLHPEDCILQIRKDHEHCKVSGVIEHEPPGCPDYCDLTTYNYTSYGVKQYYFSPCHIRNDTVEFFCGDNAVEPPPIMPWKDCPLSTILGPP